MDQVFEYDCFGEISTFISNIVSATGLSPHELKQIVKVTTIFKSSKKC